MGKILLTVMYSQSMLAAASVVALFKPFLGTFFDNCPMLRSLVQQVSQLR